MCLPVCCTGCLVTVKHICSLIHPRAVLVAPGCPFCPALSLLVAAKPFPPPSLKKIQLLSETHDKSQ